MEKIDQFDRAILEILQVDARTTSEALGERVGLSPTACQRRIKRLRESGALAAEVAVVDPEVIGRHLTILVHLTLRPGGAQVVDGFKRTMQEIPEVQQCYYTTGEHDFTLILTAEDMAEYERFTRRVFFGNPDISRFQTVVVMDRVKVGLQVPLGVEG